MDKEYFKKLVDNPNMISGIYNFCDRWYLFQIYVKLSRAVSEKQEDEEDILKDSDGSAKVALIGIDRSIAAWGILLNHFQKQEDELLEILVILERLRKRVEKEFPNARSFTRPGFDAILL